MTRNLFIIFMFGGILLFSCHFKESNKEEQKDHQDSVFEIEIDKVRIYAGQPGSLHQPIFQWKLGDIKPSGVEPRLIEYILNQLEIPYEYVSDYPIDGYGDDRIHAIISDQADISIQGITITEGRLGKVNFSDPYYIDGLGVMVSGDSDYSSLDDLKGKKVFAYRFSTTYKWAKENLTECIVISQEDEGLGKHPIKMLRAAKIDAYLGDYSGLKREKASNSDMRIFPQKFTEEKYGIAVNKKYPNLLKAINVILSKMKESGRLEDFTRGYEK